MNWTELLDSEIKGTYKATERLMDLVNDDTLGWKPATGNNWMTVGQLLMHITGSCGACCRGFATGDWGMPEDMDPEAMLPPAEALPSIASVSEAKRLLAEDKQLAFDMLAQCGEERLANDTASAPWDPRPQILGYRMLQMVAHLSQHKAQLFYYLKLQGKSVDTGDLWGM